MTETAAAIRATFVNVRPVASRGQVQLVFEVPSEQADHALNVLGGFPKPANPVWVGVARLAEGVMDVPINEAQTPSADKKPNLVQQAAVISDKPDWDNYVKQAFPNMQERGADAMRKILGVVSRKELATDMEAAGKFSRLRENFNDYQKYGVV
jgi:hypothetical protein